MLYSLIRDEFDIYQQFNTIVQSSSKCLLLLNLFSFSLHFTDSTFVIIVYIWQILHNYDRFLTNKLTMFNSVHIFQNSSSVQSTVHNNKENLSIWHKSLASLWQTLTFYRNETKWLYFWSTLCLFRAELIQLVRRWLRKIARVLCYWRKRKLLLFHSCLVIKNRQNKKRISWISAADVMCCSDPK